MSLGNARIKPTATTATTLLEATASMVISSIIVTNLSGSMTSFRIAIRPLGATLNDSHYIYYDLPIDGNDTFVLTAGLTLQATDIVEVYATLGTLSFNLFYTT